mmetsp:Transcript_82288/g.180950  ORF Transcript_82288/g.180950 Transcript_82288/m.180950 type:complete len:281 (-) Transcript_82288:165-1007(-)
MKEKDGTDFRADARRLRFGRHSLYEVISARSARVEAENQSLILEKDPWRDTQCGPEFSSLRPRPDTGIRLENFARRKAWNEGFSSLATTPVDPNSKVRKPLSARVQVTELTARRRFNHQRAKEGVWGGAPSPLSAGEPWLEVARWAFQGKALPSRRVRRPLVASARLGQGRHISAQFLNETRAILQEAAYKGHPGRRLECIFLRVDMDRSGTLNEAEAIAAFRRVLKIPHEVISDDNIGMLCAALTEDRQSEVKIADLVKFIGPNPEDALPESRPASDMF